MWTSISRILAIAGKEFRQVRRDRLTFRMIIGIPLLQILLFGYSINQDVRHLRTGVADLSGTQASRMLVQDVEASQVLHVITQVSSAAELETLMRQGRITVGMVIPEDYERRLLDIKRPMAQLMIDGSDPLMTSIVEQLSTTPRPRAQMAGAVAAAPVFVFRPFYNAEHRSEVNIVPGLIGMILNLTMVLFTAVSIVRERERGNLELLITTPVRTSELMVGKIMPYVLIGLLQASIILLVGIFLFNVPLRGSLLDLYAAALLFIIASLSLGMMISAFAQNQFQAMQLTVFAFMPSILLSGFMFPFDGMPRAAQVFGEVLPLTHMVRLTRGILLRGANLPDLSYDCYALLAFIVVMMTLAMSRFRKRLD